MSKYIGVICLIFITAISCCTSTQASVNCNQEDVSERNLCYNSAAYHSANASLCQNINGTLRSTCYHDVAFKVDDSSICEKITDDNMGFDLKIRCMALTTKNAAICDSINTSYKNTCYLEVSGKTENLTLCRTILPTDDRCYQYFQTIK